MAKEIRDPFPFLTEADRKILYEGVQHCFYRRGQVLFQEGRKQPHLFLVKRGWVRIERRYRGRGLAVARYGPGEVLGEVAFLEEHETALGSAIAEEDVEADILDGKMLKSMLAAKQFDKLEIDQEGKVNVRALIEGLDSLKQGGFAERFYHSLAVCLGRRLREIRPGIHGVHASAHTPLPRKVELSDQQFPPELAEKMKQFQIDMKRVAVQLDARTLDAAAARKQVASACDMVVEQLNYFTTDDILLEIAMDDTANPRDIPEIRRSLASYIFFESSPVLMQSKTIALGINEQTRGWKDREFLDRIERNVPGEGPLAPFVDEWFLGRPLCRSRRHSVSRMTAVLKEALTGAPRDDAGKLHVTSLAAGTAKELFDLLADKPPALMATCLDADADAVLINEKRSHELGHENSITFYQSNLVELIRDQATFSLDPQHVIYGLGVCDMFENEDVVRLLHWAHHCLVRGGWLIVTNRDRDASNPDQAFIEHILDWPVRHRTQQELSELFAASPFGPPQEISVEEAGVNIFVRCRKQ
jgi:hypothetical protein